MKKIVIVFIFFLIIPIAYSELTNKDKSFIENVVRREVTEANQKLQNDLNRDLQEVKKETLPAVDAPEPIEEPVHWQGDDINEKKAQSEQESLELRVMGTKKH